MKTGLITVLGILLCGVTLGQLTAEKSILCVYTEYTPANYLDSKGNHTGFFVEIVRELFERRLNTPLTFKIYPWARCQTMLEHGEADFIMTIPTERRLAYSTYIPTPIWIKQYRIVMLTDNPKKSIIELIDSRESLTASKLLVLSYLGNNWSKERLEDIGVSVINAPTVDGMYNMLLAKRADILVEDTVLAQTYINTHKLQDRLVITSGIIDESPFHILLSKKSPLMKSYSDISDALLQMKEDGTIDRITASFITK